MDNGHGQAREPRDVGRRLECEECGRLSDGRAWKWRGYRADEPDTRDAPDVVLYCPGCATREFGPIEFRHPHRHW
jgi:hypothetical protein